MFSQPQQQPVSIVFDQQQQTADINMLSPPQLQLVSSVFDQQQQQPADNDTSCQKSEAHSTNIVKEGETRTSRPSQTTGRIACQNWAVRGE